LAIHNRLETYRVSYNQRHFIIKRSLIKRYSAGVPANKVLVLQALAKINLIKVRWRACVRNSSFMFTQLLLSDMYVLLKEN